MASHLYSPSRRVPQIWYPDRPRSNSNSMSQLDLGYCLSRAYTTKRTIRAFKKTAKIRTVYGERVQYCKEAPPGGRIFHV